MTPPARHATPVPRHRGLVRRFVRGLIVFATVVLVADAIFGQRGVLERVRVRQQYEQLQASVDTLKEENDALRQEARRLRDDPAAIEEIARRDLGLVKPGELLFIIKDAPSPGAARRGRPREADDDGPASRRDD